MSFEKLVAVVAPPEAPVGHRNGGQWEAVERTLGTPLPEDYKRLVNAYGVGWFANWICVFSPFSEEFSLITMKEQILGMYRQGQREAPEYAPPYPAFPEPGGLLPWGQDDNAGVFCWQTSGSPADWPIVHLDNKYSEQFRIIRSTVTGLLAGWLTGQIRGDWYPEDVDPVQERVFTPGCVPHY